MSEVHRDTYIKQEDGETPNDRNDRAIRVAAAWYTKRLPDMEILLLTNDADNRRKANVEGVTAMSVRVRHWHPAGHTPGGQVPAHQLLSASRDSAF